MHLVEGLQQNHPAPTNIPMDVEHMPYDWGPCIPNLKHSLNCSNVNAPYNDAQVHAPVDVIDHAGAVIMT